jgi:demethylmenaquinone methyltransferase/2-methoxy-6-polyprenyl-1,4-benzoquinol methylase
MSDTAESIRLGLASHPLREPLLSSAVLALQPPPGTRGLDVGCGIGLSTLPLARAVGSTGHVTGLDQSAEFLAHAERLAMLEGLSERVSLRQGDVRELPFDSHAFDWAWSVDCVGYAPMDPLPLVVEMARVVRPGGTVAALAWSSESLLPGYPRLEARLRATPAGLAPFAVGKPPELHFLRALGWLRAAGLQDCQAQTFSGTAHAPLAEGMRDALVALFEMRWPGVEEELVPEDQALHRSLCLPDSPHFVVDRPDYCAFYTYTVFHGTVPKDEV